MSAEQKFQLLAKITSEELELASHAVRKHVEEKILAPAMSNAIQDKVRALDPWHNTAQMVVRLDQVSVQLAGQQHTLEEIAGDIDHFIDVYRKTSSQMIGTMRSGFSEVSSAVRDGLGDVQRTMRDGFDGMQTTMRTGFDGVQTTMRTGFDGVQSTMRSGFGEMTSTMRSGFGEMSSTMRSGFGEMSSTMREGFGGLSTSLSGIATSLEGIHADTSSVRTNIKASLYKSIHSTRSPVLKQHLQGLLSANDRMEVSEFIRTVDREQKRYPYEHPIRWANGFVKDNIIRPTLRRLPAMLLSTLFGGNPLIGAL